MPVVAHDFHIIAAKLWNGAPIAKYDEPCVRTVAGRAYYACYHCIREAMRDVYGNPNYDVLHGAMVGFLISSGDITLRQAGNALKELREARERADYDLHAKVEHRAAEVLVDSAEEWLSRTSEIAAALRSVLPRKP